MAEASAGCVAIVDYGLGNLFSVKHACAHAGLEAVITSSRREIMAAHAVVLPGVGAFPDAMASLRRLDLVEPLRELDLEGRPLLGICLGMQLLMTESEEFGTHGGLDIVAGSVVRFEEPVGSLGAGAERVRRGLKVPQIGWNRILPASGREGEGWTGTLLAGVSPGAFMYFLHSYYVRPEREDVRLARSAYGDIEFCSSLCSNYTFGFQFHPERSGPGGLRVYRNLAALLRQRKGDHS